MFSGSDSTESQNYTQWPLNASAYQSMQNEQVDWAALAHQWIKMKEAGPPLPDKLLTAPPPPVISTPSTTKGEAPMDVENDSDSNNMGSDSNDGPNWSTQQQQAPNNWNSWGGSAWPPTISSLPMNKAPLLPTPAYNAYTTSTTAKDEQFSGNTGYWSGNGSPNARSSSAAPRIMKPHNKRFSKVNIPLKTAPHPPHLTSSVNTIQPGEASPPTIDANKRKQLPAWIREGLEKMERDKLKQMDKYRVRDQFDDVDEEKNRLREDAMEILKSTVRENEKLVKPLSDYGNGSPLNDSEDDEERSPVAPPPPQITDRVPIVLTHEEMMLKVRRTMTEILLKVTNREIAQICKEEQQRHVRKLKAVDQHVTAPSAGANLSARLGLGAYDGSGESSDEGGGEDEKTEVDSDNELKDIIKRRKEEFEKTEREIENRLAEAEAEKDGDAGKPRRESPESTDSSKNSPPEKTQDRRSHTPKPTRRVQKRSTAPSSSRSSSRSSSSSSERRYRRDRRRRSPSITKRRSSTRRKSRSRSRSRSNRSSYRSDRRSSRRSRSRSRRRRSRSRSYDAGRGKRSHKH
ncbi:arginine/serine-rich protein PNISR isoform X2 [Atheta coriaria]|uniref:arginine/serine-rich protein PNISR isoform X2 n=1 Tax=Dalotia coriaria TaxID=877792 RepID=UPI0031F460F8